MLWKRVLIGFSNSQGSLKAVEYAAMMFGPLDGVEMALVGLHEKIPAHDIPQERSPFYKEVASRLASLETDREKGRGFIDNAKNHLIKMGVDADRLTVVYQERKSNNIGKDLAAMARSEGYGTVVLGTMGPVAAHLNKELSGASIITLA